MQMPGQISMQFNTLSLCFSNAWGQQGIVEYHHEYLQPGASIEERQYAYRALFQTSLPQTDIHTIKEAARCNRPAGDSRFCEQLTERYGVVFPRQTRGRPDKERSG